MFLLVSVIRKEADVRVWTGEQFKRASPIRHSCFKTNSLQFVGGDVAETKGAPLGHDKSLVKGVTITSKKSGTRQTRKTCIPQKQTGNQRTKLQSIIPIIKPTRCTNFSNLFLELNSTCFGQVFCPSSGV